MSEQAKSASRAASEKARNDKTTKTVEKAAPKAQVKSSAKSSAKSPAKAAAPAGSAASPKAKQTTIEGTVASAPTATPTEALADVNTYDELPYPSKPFSQTHPRTLATVATLFGMQPADIHKCRVLEIGYASGNNIIPMAASLPDSEFVGVELSTVQAERARALASDLQLKNLDLRQANILDVDDSYGEFDYIIAHGIFSWVPQEVQNHILKLSRQRLKKQGVAYISYNTNPGWRMRGMLRDIMLYHADNFQNIQTKITQSRALIGFLAETLDKENSAYATLLKNEVELMKNWEDAYFRHDSLEEVNDPVYFHEFMKRADKEGLQYLGEVSVSSMAANNFSDKVKQTLDQIGNDIVQREQYMDFIRNRMFRQTLLCHKDVSLTREINTGLIRKLSFSSNCRPEDPNAVIHTDGNVPFKIGKLGFSTSCRFSKSIVTTLGEHWPEYMPFDELLTLVRKRVFSDSLLITDPQQLAQHGEIVATRIFELFMHDIMDVTLYPPTVKKDVSDTPAVASITRAQATKQPWVTNCLHQPVGIDIVNRHLLPLLDGKHDQDMIKAELLKLIQNKTLIMQQDGTDLEDEQTINTHLEQQLDLYMKHLASQGMLMS